MLLVGRSSAGPDSPQKSIDGVQTQVPSNLSPIAHPSTLYLRRVISQCIFSSPSLLFIF